MTTIQDVPAACASGSWFTSARRDVAAALIGGAVLVGLALRVAAAQGDLWLDEIWSLRLAAAVHSPDAVFWGISHDNNHFLNTLWLYLLGPDRPAWAYRALAVALGTLSIPLAARIGLRRGFVAGVAAAWLAALAMPLVVYGSEARGYAGLIFATLAAIEAFECAMDPPVRVPSGWRRPVAWRMGLAIGLGTLFHLTMLAALAVLGLAAVLRFRQRGGSLRAALDATLDLFGPSLLALIPAMAAVSAGIAVRGGFTFGDLVPFGTITFAGGYGDLLGFMLGVPAAVPRWAVFVAAAGLVTLTLRLCRGDPTRCGLVVAALVVLPGAMASARLPNLEFPRYFLVPGVVLLLAEADLVGRIWAGGATRRVAALLLLASPLAGQAAADRSVLESGRGRYSDALALMAAEGQPSYATDNRFMVETVAAFTAARVGLASRYVPAEAFCSDPPEWFVGVLDDGPQRPPSVVAGPAGCRLRFDLRGVFPTSALSGMRWTLYRRSG